MDSVSTSELKWQQAVNTIDLQMRSDTSQRKAKASRLFNDLVADSDIAEQQETLGVISTIEGVSI